MKKREIMNKQFNPAALALLYYQIDLYISFKHHFYLDSAKFENNVTLD